MDGFSKVPNEASPNEWKDYYKDKRLSELFQGLTASLVYHRPDDPVDFLLTQISSIRESGDSSNIGWWTFLPPGDDTRTPRQGCSDQHLTDGHTGSPSRNIPQSPNLEKDIGLVPLGESPGGERVKKKAEEGSIRNKTTHAYGASTKGDSAVLPQRTQADDPEERSTDGEDTDYDGDEEFVSTLPTEGSHSQTFWDVLRGSMENLPAMPQNTIRIFLSSTFSDFKAERNILPQFAYPKLEEFCAARGVDFQVVDMRWGVTDELVHDHQVSSLCISEIKTCQQLSCGPNFVVLLGDRYGWQGFPPRIEATEFSTLVDEVEDDSDLQLLRDWFKRDDNAVPPEYVLQPINVHLKHYDDQTDSQKRGEDKSAWDVASTRLQNILRACVKAARKKGKVGEDQEQKYFISVTEEEVMQGVFQSDDPSNRVMCYHRSLQGLAEAPQSKFLGKFIDIDAEQGVVNKEAESYRENLLQGKLRPKLPPNKIKEYQVKWKDVPLQKSSEPEHKDYLRQFAEDFVDDVKNIAMSRIDANLASNNSRKWTSLYHEILHHALFGCKKCEVFCGREDEISVIKNYLNKGQDGGHGPLILHGPSGMGKTALMAFVASQLKDWLGTNCCAVIRFLGTSPLSTNINETLLSVISQLSLVFRSKAPNEGSMDMFGKVRRVFHGLLQKLSKRINSPLVLMFDSVDQLSPSNGAHRMVWLPKVLPRNVYVIISMLTDDKTNTLPNTRKRLPEDIHYLQLSPLSEFAGDQIIDSHLSRSKRRLTEQQYQLVVNAFKNLRHPLYLKLVIDEAKHWASYLPVSATSILNSEHGAHNAVRVAILSLFESMESKHGVTFVQHALAYLTCGNGGLTEIEMEDVLSCDDLVLNDIYQYHEPPLEGVIRIPSLLWSRLQHALKEYICERRVDGKVVLAWYHRQFWEAAEERYLEPESKKRYFHEALAELFLQETGIKRTITLHKCQGKVIPDADRRVKLQPLDMGNLRKLQAVPYHLYHSSNYSMLVSRCLINFEWLLLKLQAFHINTVIRDFEVMDIHPDVGFFRKFLEITFDALNDDPHQLAYNIVERLAHCSKGNHHLEIIVSDAQKWLTTTDVPLMIPSYPIQLQTPDSPQLFSTMLGYDGALTKDEGMIVSPWYEVNTSISKIQTLDLKTRDIVSSVKILKPAPFQIMPDNRHYIFAEESTVGVYEMDTGDVIKSVTMFQDVYEKTTVRGIAVSESGKLAAVAVKTGQPKNIPSGKQWRSEVILYMLDIEAGKVLNSIEFRGKKVIDSMYFVQKDQILIGTTKNKIILYNVHNLHIIREFSHCETLHANTCQVHHEFNSMVGLRSVNTEVRVLLFDYQKMEVRSSDNVQVNGDQKKATPFAIHAKDDLSSFLVGSWGDTGKMPLSSICVWNQESQDDAYTMMELQPRGFKPPYALTATHDWEYALVGWQNGSVSVIGLKKKEELQDISAHAHIVNYMKVLADGKTLITVSQDHCLKVWDLPSLLQHSHDIKTEEHQNVKLDDMHLHKYEQCLSMITCDQFMVSAPSNNIWAPRVWKYEGGNIVPYLAKIYQELYDQSLKEKQLDFPAKMHGEITELPGQVLVYERNKRNEMTMCVIQGCDENASILVHHRFENTFFRLIVPGSTPMKTHLLYVVHDGTLGVYDIMTLAVLKEIEIPAITKDIPHVESTGGKKRLLYYKVGVTADERYFLIVNPGGGTAGKYIDVIQIKKGKYKQRIFMPKHTPFKLLGDGFYFLCKDKHQPLSCYVAHICANIIEERGHDFDYRCLVLTSKFLSKDKSLGYNFNNKTHSIYVWQVEPLKMLHWLQGHNHEVTSANISTDNRFLVSGSFDNTVRVWEMERGTQVCMFNVFGGIDGVFFSPSMSHVVVLCYHAPQRKRAVSLALKNVY